MRTIAKPAACFLLVILFSLALGCSAPEPPPLLPTATPEPPPLLPTATPDIMRSTEALEILRDAGYLYDCMEDNRQFKREYTAYLAEQNNGDWDNARRVMSSREAYVLNARSLLLFATAPLSVIQEGIATTLAACKTGL